MSIRRMGALAALALLIAACSPGPGTGGELQGTRWVLDAYAQDGALTIVPETVYADAEFDAHRVSGFAGCNTFDALYQSGGRTLIITQPRSTLMACDETTMAVEQAFLALLQDSRFYGVRRDTLTVFDAIGSPALVFDAAPRNPLLGKWQVDSYGTTPGTVVAVLDGTEIDVVFRIGSVGGFSGCNSYTGAYGTNGNVVRIGRLATTRIACETEVMDQETAFLAALEGASRIDSRGTSLNLTDRDGRLLVALVRPTLEGEAPASPSPSPTTSTTEAPSASAEPSATPAPTATPKPTGTPKPTATPEPTVAPTEAPTPAPSASPPEIPPTASCKLIPAGGPTVATITYPGGWSTLAEPPELACRYFDPEPITVPADPATLDTAVRADVVATPYAEAVAAATDPTNWIVTLKSEVNIRGTAVTCVGAVKAADAGTDAGAPPKSSSYACLANVQTAGTVVIRATGAADDPVFLAESAVVGLMTAASTFTPPG